MVLPLAQNRALSPEKVSKSSSGSPHRHKEANPWSMGQAMQKALKHELPSPQRSPAPTSPDRTTGRATRGKSLKVPEATPEADGQGGGAMRHRHSSAVSTHGTSIAVPNSPALAHGRLVESQLLDISQDLLAVEKSIGLSVDSFFSEYGAAQHGQMLLAQLGGDGSSGAGMSMNGGDDDYSDLMGKMGALNYGQLADEDNVEQHSRKLRGVWKGYRGYVEHMTEKDGKGEDRKDAQLAFSLFDQDGDGALSRREARAWFRCLGWCLEEHDLDLILDEAYDGAPPRVGVSTCSTASGGDIFAAFAARRSLGGGSEHEPFWHALQSPDSGRERTMSTSSRSHHMHRGMTWDFATLMRAADAYRELCWPDLGRITKILNTIVDSGRSSIAIDELRDCMTCYGKRGFTDPEFEELMDLCSVSSTTSVVRLEAMAHLVVAAIREPKLSKRTFAAHHPVKGGKGAGKSSPTEQQGAWKRSSPVAQTRPMR